MEIEIKRLYKKENYTIGKVYIDGKYFSESLEDKERGLSSDMSLEEIKKIKVKGETAIPAGTYQVLYTYSPKFKRMLPLINNVKGFDGIRVHSGNTAKDSLGCVLLGFNKEKGKVLQSRDTCNKFYKIIEDAITKRGEAITLKIE
jgi:hypothetical protein